MKIGETTKTTGSAGGCSFTGIKEGTVSVEISKDGYTTKTEEITVDETHTSFTISLVSA
ncbi:MAG: PEGA domain-containing protein [Methanobrevibacter sp.]|nr:PEGA domain-containing protein [Methanobrevibacter sp.]